MYVDHSLIKEYLPLTIFILYLIHLKTKRIEWVFHIGILSLYGFTILFTGLRILGHNLLGFITSNWRTWATPAMYLGFVILAYRLAYKKTLDHPYSITLSCHMALATGYLYEAPRYLYLQGLKGLLRVSKYSVFRVHYAIISLIIIVWMLHLKDMKYNPIVLFGIQQYEIYFLVFWAKYEWLYEIRWQFFFGRYLPWIYFYRFPAMIMMLLAISQIKLDYGIEQSVDPIYDCVHNEPEHRHEVT